MRYFETRFLDILRLILDIGLSPMAAREPHEAPLGEPEIAARNRRRVAFFPGAMGWAPVYFQPGLTPVGVGVPLPRYNTGRFRVTGKPGFTPGFSEGGLRLSILPISNRPRHLVSPLASRLYCDLTDARPNQGRGRRVPGHHIDGCLRRGSAHVGHAAGLVGPQ